MKHLKIYEKFEYSQNTKDQMDRFGWYNEEKIGYVVSRIDERYPERRSTYAKLKDAIDYLEKENNNWYGQNSNNQYGGSPPYCIYETRVRVLPEDEINLELEKDKYNL